MNKLGFGFLRLPLVAGGGENDVDYAAVERLADRFLTLGGDYFDTAYTYLGGASERAVRECLVRRHPRDSFRLCDKLPGYLCKSHADCERYFAEQLERCGVDFFDVYMLHWLNRTNYDIAERYDEFGFLREVKARGQARLIGFSYHDSSALLDEILTKHPEVDVVQLQINYLDWESAGIESRKCYQVCVRHGKRVYVMEPVKGGTLAALPPEAEALLRARHPDWTPADWALRFVQSLPLVEVCLSGMNALVQVEQNMRPFDPLTDDETALLAQARAIIERQTAVPCTGCRYCAAHCPMNIPIPDYFKLYNEISRWPAEGWKIKPAFEQTAAGRGRPGDCIGCRSCEQRCPQHLPIADYMKDVAAVFDKR